MQKVFIVVHSAWFWTDDSWSGDDTPTLAFRTRARAEAHVKLLEEEQKADPDYDTEHSFTIVETELEV